MPNNASALLRTWRPACISAWSFCLIYQALIGYDKYKSAQPLCPYSDEDYPSWYWHICYGVLGAWIIVWFVVLSKISQITDLEDKVPHLVAFNIVSIGTVSTGLALILNWGGLCIDLLGVASSSAMWGDWLGTGPLLIYIVVLLDNKSFLTIMDCFLIVSLFLCIITGFFIIIPSPDAVAIFWLVVSCVTYLPVLYLPCYCKNHSSAHQLATADGDIIQLGIHHILSKKQKLAWVLTISLPLFPLNYFIAWGGAITPAETIVTYLILSVLTKGFFVSIVMDIHLELLESARRSLSEENFRNINEARRNFLKYIFHELRSPLNSLAIGIEILEKSEDLNEGDLESLGLMKDASTFMSDTLNNVLSIQKIEEGKLDLDMTPFSISDAVMKVKAALRGGLLQKSVNLVLTKSASVPDRLLGDRYRIEHVIGNLVSNAIKFSPEYGSDVVVDISVEQTEVRSSDKVTVLLAVKDEGPGISAEDQQKLFKNFVQIRPGQLQKGGGSGLGLTIAKQIVELHGGRIGVTSVEGQGSQFYFAIPFQVLPNDNANGLIMDSHQPGVDSQQVLVPSLKPAAASVLESSEELPAKSDSIIPPASTKVSRRVLVVDDSEPSLKMLKMLLKKLDVVADTAENGRIAVDMVLGAAEPYQIVIMDNLMPEMNGVEATKLLRQQGCHVLIIGLTGNVLEDDVTEYLSVGADMILSKPLNIRSLQLILDFVAENGSVVSRPDYQLEDHDNKLRWVPTIKQVKARN